MSEAMRPMSSLLFPGQTEPFEVVDDEAREGIEQLTEEKVDKAQGVENARKLLYVGADGNTSQIPLGNGLKIVMNAGKNIVFGEWQIGSWGAANNGAWRDGVDMGIKEKYAVKPGKAYTMSYAGNLSGKTAIIYLYEFGEDGYYIKHNYALYASGNQTKKTITLTNDTHYVGVSLYRQDIPNWEDAIPENFMIEEGAVATEYEPYSSDNESVEVERYEDILKVIGENDVPSYYLDNNYLDSKCARIRELLNECAGSGDVFMFVTDQHWELNAKHSPALMNYIAKQVHIPRVFSGGDTADGIHEQYAKSLDAAVDMDVHYCGGNHDWFGTMNGNKLAYLWDMGKREQVGNTKRHYYYVDNPQQEIRYVVLSAFSNETGEIGNAYDTEQAEWLRDVALNVESGWTVIVITHALYHNNPSNTVLSLWPEAANAIAEAIGAAECDVACIIQGHMHRDHIWHAEGMPPVVTVTCDKYYPWLSSDGTDNEPWITESRTLGTITEQAFDVVVLDKKQRQLTFVRIGAPADNWTDGVSTGTVEERVVTY